MKSMLIIEGSTIVARLFAEMFERRGWNVDVCNDRASAFERLGEDARYDAILVSHCVPGTNGLQLIALIRALEHLRTTAVVMVTGTRDVKEDALAAGADAVLSKPVNPMALVWMVEKHTS
jgi:CheY-like chemotaxis protein